MYVSHSSLLPKKKNQKNQGKAKYTWDNMQVFLNIVLDEAVEEKAGGEKVRIGMVVRQIPPFIFFSKQAI